MKDTRENRISAAIITLSDKGAKGEREDVSGACIEKMLEESNTYYVEEYHLIPDDEEKLETLLREICDEKRARLILTTGGTGFSKRDITPEATLNVAEKIAPGISEAMRAASMQVTKRAMLSRGVSVIRNETLIVNLPGSPKAVRENLETVLPTLIHGIEILGGEAQECAAE